MPDLPLEVIQNIFTVSLPPRPNRDDISRLDFLLPLCLVHRSLTRFTLRILFTNVFLPDLVNVQEFVESLDFDSEFRGWVKTLDFGTGYRFDVGENGLMSRIVSHCTEAEEVNMLMVDGVNLALFASLKKLRRLDLRWLESAYFATVEGESGVLESVVELSATGDDQYLFANSFLTPEVLPCLTSLQIIPDDEATAITDLYDIASQLHHLSLSYPQENLDPLLAKCTNLRSLSFTPCYINSFARRSSKSLVALRLWCWWRDGEELKSVTEMMEAALASGLISGSADSRTVVFLFTCKKGDESVADFAEWAESVGLALEYQDGALEREWSSDWDGGYSRFTEWVHAEAERREVAATERRKRTMKR